MLSTSNIFHVKIKHTQSNLVVSYTTTRNRRMTNNDQTNENCVC